jgi:hypothetical protein
MQETIVHITNSAISNTTAVRKFFNELKDGKYLLTAKSIKKRSLPQNAYYHSCIVPMMKEGLRNAGWDDIKSAHDAHEWIKEEFLKIPMVNKLTGELKNIPGSTAKLTTKEFTELIDAVIKFAAEFLFIQIPYPNEPMVMFAEYDQNVNATIIS